jgi:hypothetical protein
MQRLTSNALAENRFHLDPWSKMPLLEDASDNPAVDNTDIQAVAIGGLAGRSYHEDVRG